MKKGPYLPAGNAQKGLWLNNFNNKLTTTLAAKLGVSIVEKGILNDDTQAYNFSLTQTLASKTYEHQCVTFQQLLKNPPNGTVAIAFPVLELDTEVAKAVPSGIFTRVSALVKKIKLSVNCTDDIKQALGIVGAEMEAKAAEDQSMPILTGKMVAGYAQLKYTKAKNDGIRLESRRGTETNFTLVEKINKPVYSDKRPNLVVGQAEKREYCAWFFIGDEVVGQVSAVITVLVS
ncbi:MAG: hypothetical protein WCP65_02070 [Bacteroidota bacterium]